VHPKRHPYQRAWAICKRILFREQLNSLDLMSGQQALTKGPRLSPGNRLGQKQPQVTTAAVFSK
jgi:hypothetical protein